MPRGRKQDVSRFTVEKMMVDAKALPPVRELNEMIFQLGTNNWQRECKNGSGLEFALGSGVLHEGHHNAYNKMDGVRSYSMYPSNKQGQPPAGSDYKVFELAHDIPICESASPNSSKRWHGFSDQEFQAYVERLEQEVYDYMQKCEEREGKPFTMMIAHHSFVNPLARRNVIRAAPGRARRPSRSTASCMARPSRCTARRSAARTGRSSP